MLYIVQQWGTNTGCSIHGWQTLINLRIFPFGGTRDSILTNIDCKSHTIPYEFDNDVVLSINRLGNYYLFFLIIIIITTCIIIIYLFIIKSNNNNNNNNNNLNKYLYTKFH